MLIIGIALILVTVFVTLFDRNLLSRKIKERNETKSQRNKKRESFFLTFKVVKVTFNINNII